MTSENWHTLDSKTEGDGRSRPGETQGTGDRARRSRHRS